MWTFWFCWQYLIRWFSWLRSDCWGYQLFLHGTMKTFSARFCQKGKSSETFVGCVYSEHYYLRYDCNGTNCALKFCRMGLIHVGRVGSTAVTVSLSIERYLAISQRDSDISSKFLFWTPIISSVLYNIPKFFELETCEESIIQYHLNATKLNSTDVPNDYADNETQIISHCDNDGMRTTSLRQNRFYIMFYVVISKVVLVEIIPWIIVITLNLLTWRKMKVFQKNRKAMLNRRNQGNESKYPVYWIQSIVTKI